MMIQARRRTDFSFCWKTAWSLGFAAVRVHARTVEQKYLGSAHWPFLAELKRRYPAKTILGSGDVFTAEDAVRMYRETGVDMVWIARGAIGNPWIFDHAARRLADPARGDRAAGDCRRSARRWRNISRSRCRFMANRWRGGGCGRWGSNTAGSIRRRRT